MMQLGDSNKFQDSMAITTFVWCRVRTDRMMLVLRERSGNEYQTWSPPISMCKSEQVANAFKSPDGAQTKTDVLGSSREPEWASLDATLRS